MTLQEFKSWFDGFTENMSETPTKLQWDRVKSRVKEIDGTVTTYPVFIDRYYPNIYPRYVGPGYPWTFCGFNTSGVGTNISNIKDDGHTVFNSTSAMYALGSSEASSTIGR